ncbi:hypothetical protein EVAR_98365_1 [Eumeta japonica]|uniref:Uncharacterized protein n=1 Tax=Eumeta variegata TaxID=151549 RepID=A0A4C2A293_EUMVA|nr:hypothetical protein EVAR_98365_1 [Eumeta japonica]
MQIKRQEQTLTIRNSREISPSGIGFYVPRRAHAAPTPCNRSAALDQSQKYLQTLRVETNCSIRHSRTICCAAGSLAIRRSSSG